MKIMTLAATVVAVGAAGFGAKVMQDAPIPQIMTEIGSVPDSITGFISSSWDGRFIYYSTATPDLRVYDRTTRATALVIDGAVGGAEVSRRGDRMVFVRNSEDGRRRHVWTVGIDPRTGVANGAPRRVSLSSVPNAMWPLAAFSPDGRTIAFAAQDSLNASNSSRLVVLGANGGPERDLHRGPDVSGLQWSGDGRSIFFVTFVPTEMAIQRVTVADGRMTKVVGGKIEFLGLTNQGRHIVGATGINTVSVWDTDGRKVGTYSVSPPGGFAHFALATSHLGALAARFNRPGALHAVSFDGGGARRLLDAKMAPSSSAMSPDGKHISVVVADTAGRYVLQVMNADGSGARTIATALWTPPDSYNHESVWSPDGRYVAYRARGGFFVYYMEGDSSRKLGIADGYAIRWRADSRSFTFARWYFPNDVRRLALLEATLDGKERVIRDLGTKYSQNSGISALGDSGVWVNFYGSIDYFTGAQSRDLLGTFPQAPGSEPTGWRRATAIAHDGSWVASSRRTPSENVIEIVPTDGRPPNTIALPFQLAAVPGLRRTAHPDNKTILVAAAPQGTTPAAIYALPIDGAAPRKIVSLARGERIGQFSISPDGRTLLYVAVRQPTTTLVQFELPLDPKKGK